MNVVSRNCSCEDIIRAVAFDGALALKKAEITRMDEVFQGDAKLHQNDES